MMQSNSFLERLANDPTIMTVLVLIIITLSVGLLAMHISKSGYPDL